MSSPTFRTKLLNITISFKPVQKGSLSIVLLKPSYILSPKSYCQTSLGFSFCHSSVRVIRVAFSKSPVLSTEVNSPQELIHFYFFFEGTKYLFSFPNINNQKPLWEKILLSDTHSYDTASEHNLQVHSHPQIHFPVILTSALIF